MAYTTIKLVYFYKLSSLVKTIEIVFKLMDP